MRWMVNVDKSHTQEGRDGTCVHFLQLLLCLIEISTHKANSSGTEKGYCKFSSHVWEEGSGNEQFC